MNMAWFIWIAWQSMRYLLLSSPKVILKYLSSQESVSRSAELDLFTRSDTGSNSGTMCGYRSIVSMTNLCIRQVFPLPGCPRTRNALGKQVGSPLS
jgi:hypothetical protein